MGTAISFTVAKMLSAFPFTLLFNLRQNAIFKRSTQLYLSLTKTPSFLFNINPGIFKTLVIVIVQNSNGDLISFHRRG